jgi:hypothetical protein
MSIYFATDLDKDAVKFASNRIFPENINTDSTQSI